MRRIGRRFELAFLPAALTRFFEQPFLWWTPGRKPRLSRCLFLLVAPVVDPRRIEIRVLRSSRFANTIDSTLADTGTRDRNVPIFRFLAMESAMSQALTLKREKQDAGHLKDGIRRVY